VVPVAQQGSICLRGTADVHLAGASARRRAWALEARSPRSGRLRCAPRAYW